MRRTGFLSFLITVCIACAIASAPVRAADEADRWRLGGFGTLGAGYHGSDGVQYRRDLDQSRGYEADRLGLRTDTRLGVQIDRDFSPDWSVMAQAVSRMSREGDWSPELTWAVVRYSASDWLDLRMGRMVADIYLHGESRHVGYAYTTIRPPADVFGMSTEDVFDGAELTASRPLGSGIGSFKVYGGRARGGYYLYGQSFTKDKPLRLGATAEWSNETLTVKASWGSSRTHHDPSLLTLRDALLTASALVPEAAIRAGQIDEETRVTHAGMGVLYERGPLSLEAVIGRERFSAFPVFEGWAGSLVAAWRIGAFKPYLGYSFNHLKPQDKPLALPPVLSALQASYDRVSDRLRMESHTVTAGVRYDFGGRYALKMQVDHVDAAASFLLVDEAGQPVRDRSVTLFTIALDFVF
ncbi:porin [Methyloversatilis thermotolerans]|uniref:porin n=1 Tax=Methyloversatilis thermotolerans TaxID=1346290 RepID=UPI00035FE879|nr:porin [Methyloversatilis thermotolerans]